MANDTLTTVKYAKNSAEFLQKLCFFKYNDKNTNSVKYYSKWQETKLDARYYR